jgi:hypothetical protein
MPYIKQENREQFNTSAKDIAAKADCAGDLNYAITVILQEYIKKKGLKYDVLNSVHGMMDCCNKELYRTVTGPYEETCINRNGDLGTLKDMLFTAQQEARQNNGAVGYKAPY